MDKRYQMDWAPKVLIIAPKAHGPKLEITI